MPKRGRSGGACQRTTDKDRPDQRLATCPWALGRRFAATTTGRSDISEVIALEVSSDGAFLSNALGELAATTEFAVPMIRAPLGRRGVKRPHQRAGEGWVATRRLDGIASNHGIAVGGDMLPDVVVQTHVSLFDETNRRTAICGKRAIAVQSRQEASPEPQDRFYLFENLVGDLG